MLAKSVFRAYGMKRKGFSGTPDVEERVSSSANAEKGGN